MPQVSARAAGPCLGVAVGGGGADVFEAPVLLNVDPIVVVVIVVVYQ